MSITTFYYSNGTTTTSTDTVLTQSSYNRTLTLSSVTLSNLVISLASSCFYNCSDLTSITIPNSVTVIGINCFYNCRSLQSITIPGNVTNLGSNCLTLCTSLSSLVFNNQVNLTTFGNNSFSNCNPMTVTYYNTANYDALSSASKSLQTQMPIGSTFRYLVNITTFYYTDGDPTTSSDTIISQSSYNRTLTLSSVSLAYFVTSLQSSCFSDCVGLKSISIPDNVTSLGSTCFFGCASLTSITIPNSVTSLGSSCFSGCTSLSSFVFNNQINLTSIGITTYEYCPSMTVTYYNTVNYNDLSSVSKSLQSQMPLGSTFSYIPNITIFYYNNGTTTTSSDFIISQSSYNRTLTLSSVTLSYLVTSLGSTCFYGCSGLTSITIPNNVTSLESTCFFDCTNLTSITINSNSITSLGTDFARNCYNLTSITIPNSVTVIGINCFYNCISLQSITIPGNVTNLGSNCLTLCTSLSSLVFNNQVNLTTFGNNCFSYCNPMTVTYYNTANYNALSTTSKNLRKTMPVGSSFSYISNITTFYYTDGGPTTSSDTIISQSSYDRNLTLSSVSFDYFVSSLRSSCFSGCTGLTSITIPDNVTSIGDNCFSSCTGLTTITIPDNVTSLGSSCFYGCTGLTTFVFNNQINLTSIRDNTYQGCPAMAVTYYNTANYEGLSSASQSLQTQMPVGSTFSYLFNITTFNYTDGGPTTSSDTIISQSSYNRTLTLASVSFAYFVTSLENDCFSGCSGLTSITIPDNVTSLGSSCFFGCINLTSITINSNSITSLGQDFARNCSNLISITIPNSVTSIGNTSFSDCTGLTTITIPNNVISLGSSCFSGCTGLTNFEFSNQNKLTSVGTNTYDGCPAMTVTYYGTANYNALTSASQSLQSQMPDDSTFIYIPFPCFKENTKILTDKGYIPIQDLRKGDLVKTYKHGFLQIDMIGKKEIYHQAKLERIKEQLYQYTEEVFEPLILTGCHSVLVDWITQEQGEKTMEEFGDIFITDDKIRLFSYLDERSTVYEIPGTYTIYHLALENDYYYRNYGIYANGLLVESCSKRYLLEYSTMELIE